MINLYEITYHIQLDADSLIYKNKLVQIPATTEFNALVSFGQYQSEDSIIDVVSIKKVATNV